MLSLRAARAALPLLGRAPTTEEWASTQGEIDAAQTAADTIAAEIE